MKPLSHYLLLPILSLVVLLSSCAREYDISNGNLDLNITLGGDSLRLPIGSTERLSLGDFLDLGENEYFHTDTSGEYYFELGLSLQEQIDLSEYIDDIAIDGLHEVIYKDTYIPEEIAEIISKLTDEYVEVELETADTLMLSYDLTVAQRDGIVDLDSILFDNAHIILSVDMETTYEYGFPEDYYVNIEISLPLNYYLCESSGAFTPGKIILHGEPDKEGHLIFNEIDIEKVAFDVEPGDEFKFEDLFVLEHLSVSFLPADLVHYAGEHIYLDIHFDIASSDGEKISPKGFYGLVDRALDPITESIALSEIPSFLREDGVNVDFVNAYALLDVYTNSGIPFEIGLAVLPEGSPDALECLIHTTACDEDSEAILSTYVFSEEYMEQFASRQWYQMNINELLNPIPEKIDFVANVSTALTAEHHYVDLQKDYFIDTDFKLVVPMSFGEELYLPVCDTISGLPEGLGEILTYAAIELFGTVETTIPLNMELSLQFLDKEGRLLDIQTEPVVIEGTSEQGEPVLRDFSLLLDKRDEIFEIDAVVVKFVLFNGLADGIPLSEDCYLDLNLGLMFPEGITLDLNDYLNQ